MPLVRQVALTRPALTGSSTLTWLLADNLATGDQSLTDATDPEQATSLDLTFTTTEVQPVLAGAEIGPFQTAVVQTLVFARLDGDSSTDIVWGADIPVQAWTPSPNLIVVFPAVSVGEHTISWWVQQDGNGVTTIQGGDIAFYGIHNTFSRVWVRYF